MALTNGKPRTDEDFKEFVKKIREIRERESVTRDVRAREIAKDLKEERNNLDRPSPRAPALVCRKMKHLPPAAKYKKHKEETDVD